MTELPAKINIGDALFTHVPRKQPPRAQRLRVARRITNEDLEWMIRQRTAVPLLQKLGPALLCDLTTGLVSRLVNAGPHVVDIRLAHEFAADGESHSIVASTPAIPTKTYGPEVKRADLVVSGRGEAPAVEVAPPPSLWSRLKSIVAEINKPIQYDGPGGWIDG